MTSTPNNPSHFKPGQSGNLKGRPKGTFSLATILKRKLQEVPEGEQRILADSLIDDLIKKAFDEKDPKAMKLIMNYVDGLPRATIGLDGGEGKPIEISSETKLMVNNALNNFLNGNTGDSK